MVKALRIFEEEGMYIAIVILQKQLLDVRIGAKLAIISAKVTISMLHLFVTL